ncbi:hypothetical protein [Glycomyces xiaoerkulensis]|uniref:hypothetical protein n=1 Tax=Glycomyces xiaoerkulensis TaxID=2038139 RepID=UPI0013000AAB|nr:hypothetical protein [Glycomyces xiaoerkulensis]
MGEATIHLNRWGLERGRTGAAVAAAAAIVLPLAFWIGLERLVGDTTEQFAQGETVQLESYPVGDVHLQFLPPGPGWSSELSLSRHRITVDRGRTSATVQVDAGVDSLERLLERRAERLTAGRPGIAVTNVREYYNEVNGLEGFRADLYGRNLAGSIVVVGGGDGAAATLILLAPTGRLEDDAADADAFVSSFVLADE